LTYAALNNKWDLLEELLKLDDCCWDYDQINELIPALAIEKKYDLITLIYPKHIVFSDLLDCGCLDLKDVLDSPNFDWDTMLASGASIPAALCNKHKGNLAYQVIDRLEPSWENVLDLFLYGFWISAVGLIGKKIKDYFGMNEQLVKPVHSESLSKTAGIAETTLGNDDQLRPVAEITAAM
jgi:hypothetical protein